MQISKVGADDCGALKGAVVVIDVLRAFTTAAFAFAAGAREIFLVRSVEEAFALREQLPHALVMGEVGGFPVDGFDHGNSPSEIEDSRLAGRTLIQRTTAGTKAVLEARGADVLLAASFVCAEATVKHVTSLGPDHVGLVSSGKRAQFDGSDDGACADYLEARLRGGERNAEPFVERVRACSGARKFLDPAKPAFPRRDLDLALEVDRFDFAMVAVRTDDRLVLGKVGPPATD